MKVKPGPGLPMAKKPKRNVQASMAMSITFLMPKRLRQKGMSRMQSVSLICEMEVTMTLYFTIRLSAYCGKAPQASR